MSELERGFVERVGSCLRRNDEKGRMKDGWGTGVTERGRGGGGLGAWVLYSARYPRRARV